MLNESDYTGKVVQLCKFRAWKSSLSPVINSDYKGGLI